MEGGSLKEWIRANERRQDILHQETGAEMDDPNCERSRISSLEREP